MRAMDVGVHVLLVHEMPGSGGQEARFGCEFGCFFSHPDGATPNELLTRGIYSEIAVPLKGGAWREASMALMGSALGMSKDDVASALQGNDLRSLREGVHASMMRFRGGTRTKRLGKAIQRAPPWLLKRLSSRVSRRGFEWSSRSRSVIKSMQVGSTIHIVGTRQPCGREA